MAFQFASTNLVFELGLVLWLFLGWRFTLAEFVGGIFLIVLMWGALHLLVSRDREEEMRDHARKAETGHVHPTATDVALNFRADVQMLWKEIVAGFVIAGYVSLLPRGFFNALFITDAWAPLRLVENVLVGPVVAALAFVCSIGNVPLAAVLWNGGISFGGVLAFIFADLIVLPILDIYRKYYGWRMAGFLFVTFFAAMAAAALAIELVFDAVGLIPDARNAKVVEASVTWNYTTVLNIAFLALAAVLVWRFVRTGGLPMLKAMNKPADAHGHAH
jgi:uncharacterized protein